MKIKLCDKDPVPVSDYQRKGFRHFDKTYSVPCPLDSIQTTGYLNYISAAWQNHYSIVLTPTDIWYMVICEITPIIKKNPEYFANLFTSSPTDKQEILVPTNNVETIDPSLVIDILKEKVPSDSELFLPSFTTDTQYSRLALNVAFCDMVSPYYTYSTFMCGIPVVDLKGTKLDWILLRENLRALKSLFKTNFTAYLQRCHDRVNDILQVIVDKTNSVELFSKMVKLEKCGSGSQYEMTGWIMDFLNIEDPTYPLQLEGLHPHTSVMKYKNLETQRKFTLSAGIFYSVLENEFLIPVYNAHRIEITNEPAQKGKKIQALPQS